MTTRAAFPPMRYPRWRYEGTPRITRSANFPGSKLPTWSPNPIACAELIVAATTASDGSRPLWWHASAIVSCVDSDQQFGLKSVPRATATPAAISRRPSANGRWETKDAAGSKTPTTAVRASASIPSGDEWSRWSADAAPRSAASAAPPESASSSAWTFVARPADFARPRTRLPCSAVKYPSSTKTSQYEASRRDRIDHFIADEVDVGVAAPLEFRGNRMRPEERPNDIDARGPTRFLRGAQDLELVRGPESVSALPLDRRRPEGEHGSESFGGGTNQVLD